MKTMRIVINGASGTGKSSLGQALAKTLDVPYFPENLAEVVKTMQAVAAVGKQGSGDRQEALTGYFSACEIWLKHRAEAMRDHPDGYVIDRWAVDIWVRWLFSGVAATNDELHQELMRHLKSISGQLDAVVVLPLMDLAAHEDWNHEGLRRHTQWSRRLHEQALIRGLLDDWVEAPKLYLPRQKLTVDERVNWVTRTLARRPSQGDGHESH